jgi:hypothetical protein
VITVITGIDGGNSRAHCLPMAQIARDDSVWAFEPASTTADLLKTPRNANQLHTGLGHRLS